MKVKIAAIGDAYHKLTGRIALENFEEHRLNMAENIWTELKHNELANAEIAIHHKTGG